MVLFGQRRSVFPSRGVLGGALCLLFLVLYFVVFDGFRAHPKGVSVMLSLHAATLTPQAVIDVRPDKDGSVLYRLNHKLVSREALTSSLRAQMGSAPGFVSIEADVNTRYMDVVDAMDSAVAAGAQVLILPAQKSISKKSSP